MFTNRPLRIALLAAVTAVIAPAAVPAAAEAAGTATAPATGGVSVSQAGGHITLSNGYVQVGFNLANPGIDVLRGDLSGQGNYGANVAAAQAGSLHQGGIFLERTDAVPAPVLNTVGITDTAHRADGQFPGPVGYSYAAELLPPAGSVTVPANDSYDQVPLLMPDTSGAAPNVAQAEGQTYQVPAADQKTVTQLNVFGSGNDGAATGTFVLHFADGSTASPTVSLPDWGGPGQPTAAVHPAIEMAYRHDPSGNDAPVPFFIYHAVVPVSSASPLVAVTFPSSIASTTTSSYPTTMEVAGLTLSPASGAPVPLDLGANDHPSGQSTFASTSGAGPDLHATVLQDSPAQASVRIDGVTDDPSNPVVTSSWTLSLDSGSRSFRLQTATHALRTANIAGLRLASYLTPQSVYGLFQRGVVQDMNSPGPYFATTNPLDRVYTLGGGGSFDMLPSGNHPTVLLSAPANSPGGGASPFRSGVEQVLAGTYPQQETWSGTPWSSASPTVVTAGQGWTTDDRIAVNDHDFPAGTLSTRPNLPLPDLESIYTAVYGSSAGVLDTFANPGEVAVTLAAPGRSYGGLYNFYDPDTWETVNALVDSGDPYLISQARTLIEKSGSAILPSGQVPHNFAGEQPTYVAISGATQTGPNIFWIEAALAYANGSGDQAWLAAHIGQIEQALGYLTGMYDPSLHLVKAPGPLWIDVFKRYNYTADTNVFMVKLLRDVATAEQVLGRAAQAKSDDQLATSITAGINDRLWAGNHYITQLNPDGTTTDFGDNDSNLLAVAFGVAPPARASQVLAFTDSGPCMAAPSRPAWVSQVYYGPGDTYGGNTGDSATAMGRIAWADGMARYQAADLSGYQNGVAGPIQSDLLASTWLTERYNCAGHQIRSPYYHEYPEVLTMLLHDASYGISIGLGQVTIAPFGHTSYNYEVGDVAVSYSSTSVSLRVPGTGDRLYTIHGLVPGARYNLQAAGGTVAPPIAAADGQGTLSFTAPAGQQVAAHIIGSPPAT